MQETKVKKAEKVEIWKEIEVRNLGIVNKMGWVVAPQMKDQRGFIVIWKGGAFEKTSIEILNNVICLKGV